MASKKSQRKRANPIQKTSYFKKNKTILMIGLVIIIIIIIAGIWIVYGSNNEGDGVSEINPIAVIETSIGTFNIELYVDKVPITANNFITHAKNGYYDDLIFHRVIPNFMIQGGDPNGDGTGGYAAEYHEGYGDKNNQDTWSIPDEFHEELSNNRGTISMANSGPNTGGSQFFINVVDNTYLDYDKQPLTSKHAVFGKVVDGLDVVDKISNVTTGPQDKPITDVKIISITIEE
jgi:cyclophilin family peptidyl-prolyl cis-trans isomerase